MARKPEFANTGFTPAVVWDIHEQAARGMRARDLARKYGCGVETIRRMLRGETFLRIYDLFEEGTENPFLHAAGKAAKEVTEEEINASLQEFLRISGRVKE